MDRLNATEIEAGFVRFNELKSSLSIGERENPDKIREISSIASAYAKEMAKKRYDAEKNTHDI